MTVHSLVKLSVAVLEPLYLYTLLTVVSPPWLSYRLHSPHNGEELLPSSSYLLWLSSSAMYALPCEQFSKLLPRTQHLANSHQHVHNYLIRQNCCIYQFVARNGLYPYLFFLTSFFIQRSLHSVPCCHVV